MLDEKFNFLCDGNYCDYLTPIVIFLWASFAWRSYLELRQYRLMKATTEVPDEFKNIITPEELEQSKAYQIDCKVFHFIHDFYSQLELGVILYCGLLAYSWQLAERILNYFNFNNVSEELQSEAWMFVVNIFSLIMNQPWSLYKTFVLEEKHGFNKMTLKIYIKDLIKSLLISFAINIPVIYIIIFIIKLGGPYFYIYLWVFMTLLLIFILWIYPTWIAPLFDKYVRLRECTLRDEINELADKLKFPLSEIYVVNSSLKSAHSNAYFYGFWRNKRIVLFDTLFKKKDREEIFAEESGQSTDVVENRDDRTSIHTTSNSFTSAVDVIDKELEEDITTTSQEDPELKDKTESDIPTNEEILAILTHELGHWYLNHNLKGIFLQEIVFFVYIVLFSQLMNNTGLFASFGFMDSKPILVGFIIIFGFLFSPIDFVLSFLVNQLIRSFEYSADNFATLHNKTQEMCSALIKLTKSNKSFPLDDKLYSAFHKSHPSTSERLKALTKNYKDD